MSLDPSRDGEAPHRFAWLTAWLQHADDEVCDMSAEDAVAALLGVSADNPACRLLLALQQRGTALDAMDLTVFRAWAGYIEARVDQRSKEDTP